MRYWFCILVLALADPVIGDINPSSTCPYKSLNVDSDYDLPDSTGWYYVDNCSRIEWTFDFIRTSKMAGRTIIYLQIDSTNIHVAFDSDDYSSPGHITILGEGQVQGFHNRLKMEVDPVYATLGHFRKMLFQAWYSN